MATEKDFRIERLRFRKLERSLGDRLGTGTMELGETHSQVRLQLEN